MIVLPKKNMTLVGINPNPLVLPYRASVQLRRVGYINGIPTGFLGNYNQTVMGFHQTTRFAQSFTQTTIPFLTSTCFFLNKYIVYSPTANRSFSKVNYVIDPFSGRIEYAELSNPVNMQYCGTGGINAITRFIAPFMDPYKTNVVMFNTYSGGVSGGADTCAINMRNNNTIGFNSNWNGFGSGPYESVMDPVKYSSTNNSTVQINDKMIASVDPISNNIISVYSADNGIMDGGGCLYNEIIPKLKMVDSFNINTILGENVFGGNNWQLTSKMDSSFIFAVYAPSKSYIIYVKYPGPVIQIAAVAYFGTASNFASFIDDDGYIILVNTVSDPSSFQYSYVSSDTLQLSYSINSPVKSPTPFETNNYNITNNVNINRKI